MHGWRIIVAVWAGAFGIAGCTATLVPQEHPAPRPPNVVIVFADDLGYGDLGSYGHPEIETPTLDRMASEGQRWTNFYVGASVCSPSRAGLLTGRLHVRSGMYGTEAGTRVLFPDSTGGLPADEITIAEALRAQGYATGAVGKWHLGHLPQYLPAQHGFDSWFGLPYSNDMDTTVRLENWPLSPEFHDPRSEYWNVPLMRDGEIIERPATQETLTRRYTEEAVAFIEAHADQPFFLYVPHTMVHIPLFRDAPFAGRSRAGVFGDTVAEIDWSVSEILGTLDRLGLDEQTLVVFTSDNGPWTVFREHGGSAGLLRMGKGTTWEGGMRVPAIFRWPGHIQPGVIRDIGSTLDLFATITALTDGSVPGDRVMDSLDLSPALLAGEPSPRETMVYYRYDEMYAIRKGAFKAHFITEGEYGEGGPRTVHDPPLLYNLEHDPAERFDVASAHPDVVADLVAEAEAYRASLELPTSQFDTRTGG